MKNYWEFLTLVAVLKMGTLPVSTVNALALEEGSLLLTTAVLTVNPFNLSTLL